LGKSFLHGSDKEERPLCIVRARLHHQGDQTEHSLERFTVHLLETARLVLIPPVDTASLVFDMTQFSLANMDYAPVKFMIKCFEANYPESLGVVIVHKAPWVFQGIWKIIKGWLDPVVAGKVKFTNSVEDMQEFIAREHIMSDLGGDDKYEYKYIEPQPDENSRMADTATRDSLLEERATVVKHFEAETQKWVEDSSGAERAKSARSEIAEKLRRGYWELDPYLRAKSLYDRTGMIRPGGNIDLYPKPAPGQTTLEGGGPKAASHDPSDLD